MEHSNLIHNARDIDSKKGIVSFYFADFNSIDAHGRRMDKNAFNRTFKNNFNRFAHLLNHNENMIIGKPLEVGKDTKGAYMVSQISKTSHGKDALILYEEGILKEHSFGFRIINSNVENNNGEEVEVVTELQMFEASSVTWGANPQTPTISLNSNTEKIEKQMEALTLVNKELVDLLKNYNKNKSEVINLLNDIQARLPDGNHQTSQKSDVDDVIKFINEKY